MGIFHVTRFLSVLFVRKTFGYYLETIVSVPNVEIGLTGTRLIAQADLSKRFEQIEEILKIGEILAIKVQLQNSCYYMGRDIGQSSTVVPQCGTRTSSCPLCHCCCLFVHTQCSKC